MNLVGGQVPPFQVSNSAPEHQDTMSLQDVDLGMPHDDQAEFDDPDKIIQVPHIERTLTEESAGKVFLGLKMRVTFLILQ